MAQFSVNPKQFDPYKNFKFRLKWDGHYVAGFSNVSALDCTTQVSHYRESDYRNLNTNLKLPGGVKFSGIMLEHGISHDAEFVKWTRTDVRKDLSVEIHNDAGERVLTYELYRCWVSAWACDSDSYADAMAIQRMTLECEGCEGGK